VRLPLSVSGLQPKRRSAQKTKTETGEIHDDSKKKKTMSTIIRAAMALVDTRKAENSEEEKERKKGRGKQLLLAGLATVATIHAAHSVYQTAEKHEKWKKELRKGEISESDMKKQRNRGLLQDTAAVGIAALGIKGAYGEWMEMKEKREEHKKERVKWEEHRAKRAARREKQRADREWTQRLLAERQQYESQFYTNGGFHNSMPNLYTSNLNGYSGGPPYAPPQHASGPAPTQYYDDNPYSAAVGPPQGYTASSALPPAPNPPPAAGNGYVGR